jgi:hypothetical protein
LTMDFDGKLLSRIEMLADVAAVWAKDNQSDDLVEVLLQPTTLPKGRLQDMKPALMLAVLLRAAELTRVDGFQTEIKPWAEMTTSIDRLSRFVAICGANRTIIEEVLDRPMRGDFGTNPVRQLNEFLGWIGLRLDEVSVKKVAGRKVRYYAFPEGMAETMLRLAASRLAVRAREEEARERAREDGKRKRRPEKSNEGAPIRKPDLLTIAGDQSPEQGTEDSRDH